MAETENRQEDESSSNTAAWALLGTGIGAAVSEYMSYEDSVVTPAAAIERAGHGVQHHLDSLLGNTIHVDLGVPLSVISKGKDFSLPQLNPTRREMLGLMSSLILAFISDRTLRNNYFENEGRMKRARVFTEQVTGISNRLGKVFGDKPYAGDEALFIVTGGGKDTVVSHHEWWGPFERAWRVKNGDSPQEAQQAYAKLQHEIELSQVALTPTQQEMQFYQALWENKVFVLPWFLVDDYDVVGMSMLLMGIIDRLPKSTKITLAGHSMGPLAIRALLLGIQEETTIDIIDPATIEQVVLVGDPYIGDGSDTQSSWSGSINNINSVLSFAKKINNRLDAHTDTTLIKRITDMALMLGKVITIEPKLIRGLDASQLPFPVVLAKDPNDVLAQTSETQGERVVVLDSNGVYVRGPQLSRSSVIPPQLNYFNESAQEAHRHLPDDNEAALILSLK